METLVINSDQENSSQNLNESMIEIDNKLLTLLNCYNCKNLCDQPKIYTCCNKISCKSCYSKSIKQGFCLICAIDKPTMKGLDYLFQALFDSVRVSCKFYCGTTFGLKDVKKHEKFCLANPDALFSCQKCELTYTKEKLDKHDCTKELLTSYKKLKSVLESRSLDEDENIKKIKFTLKLHEHPQILVKRKVNWRCNYCRTSHNTNDLSWYCYECDCDLCETCFAYAYGKKENSECHIHKLNLKFHSSYDCDICKTHYTSNTAIWCCEPCNFTICIKCRFKDEEEADKKDPFAEFI